MRRKKIYLRTSALLVLIMLSTGTFAKDYILHSPDHRVSVTIGISDSIGFNVIMDGKSIVKQAKIAFLTDMSADKRLKVRKVSRSSVNTVLHPVVSQKASMIADIYNQLRIDFSDRISLEWRAYDNGVSWRWLSNIKGEYKVTDEVAEFMFNKKDVVWYPGEKSFYSGNEPKFTKCTLENLGAKKLACLPVLFDINGVKVLITEANLLDYAGMWLESSIGGKLRAVFPHYPKEKEIKGDRDEYVHSRENFIAWYSSPTEFPWRVIALAREDKDLLNNTLVYQLATPAKDDFAWVKPGKALWDWWNNCNIYKVDFKAGMNTETYKYLIDFAASNGLEYVVLDEGWYDLSDIMKLSRDIDMDELSAYGRSKNVGLVLWCTWVRLDEKLDGALKQFSKWGIKAIKVDFMSRDDQEMVGFYTRVSREAAKYKLLVDFHGCYKPTGLYRTYPNVVTFEGVYGQEQCKGDRDKAINPDHNLILPFNRMVAGPMDYTPGAMENAHKQEWYPNWNEPMSIGTRCHQLAMYVVYESPLQMLSDSPTKYLAEPECMEFLRTVPTVWKQTIPLDCKVGEYVSIARQAFDGQWYIGCMTNSDSRELSIKLDFLPEGEYQIKIWKDGINATRNAKDFSIETIQVNKNTVLPVQMVSGGGYAAMIRKH